MKEKIEAITEEKDIKSSDKKKRKVEKRNPELIPIGERLKSLRLKKGESQKELGKIFHTSQKAISNYEHGITVLPLEIQIQYAKHYNVSHDFLCTGEDGNSILKLLETYVTLEYPSLSEGAESYKLPILKIKKSFFDYLTHTAQANDSHLPMPDEIRKLWTDKETEIFYSQNKKDSNNETKNIVPVPKELFKLDEQIKNWKLEDFIREIYNQFYKKLKNK